MPDLKDVTELSQTLCITYDPPTEDSDGIINVYFNGLKMQDLVITLCDVYKQDDFICKAINSLIKVIQYEKNQKLN